jgi:hypothetical protein
VRASRREPTMAALLAEAAPGLFELTSELAPAPGDHVHAYGSDATLAELARTLPRGVVLHGHGSGFAAAVLERPFSDDVWDRLALDVALFDQRGCLSPRPHEQPGRTDRGEARRGARSLGGPGPPRAPRRRRSCRRHLLPGHPHVRRRALACGAGLRQLERGDRAPSRREEPSRRHERRSARAPASLHSPPDERRRRGTERAGRACSAALPPVSDRRYRPNSIAPVRRPRGSADPEIGTAPLSLSTTDDAPTARALLEL